MRCWARFSRAPATIFIARVIFCVDFTLTMRVRITFNEGTSLVSLAERLPELLERAPELRLEILVEHLLRTKGLQDVRVRGLEEGGDAPLVGGELADLQSVEKAFGAGVDDHDLLLCGQRDVLPLLQDLDETYAS